MARTRPSGRRIPRLGQHFLHDSKTLHSIASALDLQPQDTVVEIGAGNGVLTRILAERARSVTAVEIDATLVERLRRTFDSTPQVIIMHANALDLDPCDLSLAATYKLAGNIPYYITGSLLRRYIGGACKPRMAVLLVQLEVAQRMLAEPGAMSMLALSVQLYAEPSMVTRVPPRAFRPPPKIDSAVIKLDMLGRSRVPISSEERFFAVARAGFSSRRKQLINSLAHGLSISKQESGLLLEQARIAPTTRAEALSLDQWSALAAIPAPLSDTVAT